MKSKSTITQHFFRRRQFRLFLLAVVLPCTVLIGLTWHVIGQQQELSEKRLADERRRIVKEIGQKLLVRLEEIKLHEVSARANAEQSLNTLDYTSEHVCFIGIATKDHLLLPWEVSTSVPRQSDTALLEKIRGAEEQEFVLEQFAQAIDLYRECVALSQPGAEQAYARLLLARVLTKAGQQADSLAEYRRISGIGPEIVDEHGVAYCLYATSRLIERNDFSNGAIQAIASVLHSRRWLSPAESFMLRDMIEALLASGSEVDFDRRLIETYRQDVLMLIHRQEQSLAVQRDFAKLTLITEWNGRQEEPEAIWVPFGEGPLLISLTPDLPGGQRLAIVIRGGSMLDALSASTFQTDTVLTDIRLTGNSSMEGESLGPNFPGLSVVYTTNNGGSLPGSWGLQQSIYLAALLVVLCVVMFGAYSYWRDVTLELRMAEMRSQFIASVSHELKTPLTAIRILAETLLLGRVEGDRDKGEYLDTIVNESQRLTRLLNNVLDFSKIEKGNRTYRMELTCLAEIVHAAVRAMQYPLTQRDFHLTVSIEDDLPDILVDRDAIEQALLNLISNAMKYSGDSREIELRVVRSNGHVVIEVSDHGIGIEPGEQKRIFEKFYRVAGNEDERVPGTGLGLALVSHIIEAHDGHIEVHSEPGRGSTFSIYLPLEVRHESNSHH